MSRRPGLFNEALAGFFRSTEAIARRRSEAGDHAAAVEQGRPGGKVLARAAAAPARPDPPALSVPVEPDDQTDVDWLSDSTR
jgi:hypothetical protein